MDTYQLGRDLGDLRTEVRLNGQRQIYVAELTLREVREMRSDADRRHFERAAEKQAIPRWDVWLKKAATWLLPLGVLLSTGSAERAVDILKAL